MLIILYVILNSKGQLKIFPESLSVSFVLNIGKFNKVLIVMYKNYLPLISVTFKVNYFSSKSKTPSGGWGFLSPQRQFCFFSKSSYLEHKTCDIV